MVNWFITFGLEFITGVLVVCLAVEKFNRIRLLRRIGVFAVACLLFFGLHVYREGLEKSAIERADAVFAGMSESAMDRLFEDIELYGHKHHRGGGVKRVVSIRVNRESGRRVCDIDFEIPQGTVEHVSIFWNEYRVFERKSRRCTEALTLLAAYAERRDAALLEPLSRLVTLGINNLEIQEAHVKASEISIRNMLDHPVSLTLQRKRGSSRTMLEFEQIMPNETRSLHTPRLGIYEISSDHPVIVNGELVVHRTEGHTFWIDEMGISEKAE